MVMGMENRAPTADELGEMIELLEQGLRAGALGMSSGPVHAARLVRQARGDARASAACSSATTPPTSPISATKSNNVLDAVQEAIAVAIDCEVHVEIVHFKCSGTNNWGKAATALQMIADAKARGLDVDCDAYPYAAGSNPLKNLLPQWVQAGGVPAMLERLREPRRARAIRADIERDGLNNWGRIPSWDCVQISISPQPAAIRRPHHRAARRRARRHDPVDTLCDYLADDQGATRVLVTSISEDDIERIVASPMALVGSDGNCVAPYGQVGKGMPHPRFYGTFPRIIASLRARARRAAARACDPQDDRRDRTRAQAQGPRPAARKAIAPTSRSSTRRISATARPTPTRTSSRPARAPRSSSTASWWWRTPLTPARCRGRCCGEIPAAPWVKFHRACHHA